MKGREVFKVEGGKITRLRRHCPKCGDGVFLAEHKNRISCGKCGYTEFKSSEREAPEYVETEKKPEPVKKNKEDEQKTE